MAYMLKINGFDDVTILEKSNRIGGKATSVNYNGTVHQLSTMAFTRDYRVTFSDIDSCWNRILNVFHFVENTDSID